MHSKQRRTRSRSSAPLVVLAVAMTILVAACTTKRLETVNTSTTSTTAGVTATTGRDAATTTSSDDDDSTTTSSDVSPWSLNASEYRGQDGLQVSLDCPPDGETTYSVWGTGTYTDDSSICLAAVHDGRITVSEGGTVRFEIAPGLDSYEGSEANGVTSQPYPAWGGSFFFVSE